LAEEVGGWAGFDPDPAGRLVLDALFAEDGDGLPACFAVGVVAPRQTIKTATLQEAALTWLFVMGVELVIWTAHLYDTAKKAHVSMVGRIEKNPDLRAQCKWPPPMANGSEAIELLSGERIEFHARSKGGGRGLTGGRVILDEAFALKPQEMGALLPVMMTIPDAQVVYGSSAGMLESAVLRGVRDRGRAGGDLSLAWLEWCARRKPCASEDCTHVVGSDGCALDDRALWREANPALAAGRTTEQRIVEVRLEMPAGEFAREILGWWDDPPPSKGGALSMDDWDRCRSVGSTALDPVVLAFEVSHDRRWSTIGAAGVSPLGGTHVEVVDNRRGTGWVVPRLVELRDAQRPAAIVCNPSGPAGGLLADCHRAGLDITEASAGDYAKACQAAYDAIGDGMWRHDTQPELDRAVAGVAWRRSGDARVFDRRGETDITPLVAVTLAAWAAGQERKSVYEERDMLVLG